MVEPLIGALLSLLCLATHWASLQPITILLHMREEKETPVSMGEIIVVLVLLTPQLRNAIEV